MTTLVRRLRTAASAATCAGGMLLLGAPWALAQTPPAPAASSAGGERDYSISDRVKKDAASPLYWIRLNAQKPDAAGAKAGPKITEVRPVAPARPAATAPAANAGAGPANAPPRRSVTAAATPPVAGGANLPAAAVGDTPPPLAASTATVAAPPPAAATTAAQTAAQATTQAGTPPGQALPGAGAGLAAAGLAGGSAPSATDAARAATAASGAAADDDEDDQPLAVLKASEPEFSPVAMRRLRKGNVQVRFDVMPDGHVANATVVQTTNRSLNDAALEAVNAWLFKPVRSTRSAVVDLGFDLDS
ncbi:MAG: energy transducer TonB [Burkholderiaceae bacterium]